MSDGEVSLYFGLKPGERADLEVVALAALEWIASVREAARELSPDAQIRIELLNAQDGSLRLNAILEWIETQLARIEDGAGQYPRIRKLAVALAIFVPTVGVPTYDFYFGAKPTVSLNEDDRRLLNELLERTRANPGVKEKREKFFKTLERDKAISGAGVSEEHTEPPIVLVPKEQFAERSGLWTIQEEDKLERTTYPTLEVVLVAPVLIPKPRAWLFQPGDGLPEFFAKMKDKTFLSALEQDHVRERLRVGIPMKIRLEVKEKNVGGVWMVKHGGRSVIEVISPKVD